MMRVASRVAAPALALIGLFLLAAATPAVDLETRAVEKALAAIRPEALGASMRFLASDSLEGRGTGTRGYDRAARYVAARFESLGLEPAGGGRSWFQPVPLRATRVVAESCGLSLVRDDRSIELVHERDFVMSGDPLRERAEVRAPVVFAGYGVTAPELGYDDFAHLDARGRIVAVLSGAPPRFAPTLRAHYSNSRVKEANLAAHGAMGEIVIRTPADERRASWDRTVRQSRFPSMRWLDRRGRPDGVQPALRCAATLNRSGAEALFQGAPRALDWVFANAESGTPLGFQLATEARMRRHSRHEAVSSPNVVARLPGSDPRLRGETVVLSAHLDHLGIGTPVEGDSIYNGAFDNATGVASILELAAVFAASTPRPRRSLVFLAVTGEEKGLQGSSYFASHTPPEAGRVVADLNLDMYVMIGKLRKVVAYGAEHSSLGRVAERAASRLDLSLMPDPNPAEVIFVRSDQYSFVRQGVPSLFLVGRGEASYDSLRTEWMRTIYHSPQDDLGQPLDLESLAEFTRLHFLAATLVANEGSRPAWKRGDFFARPARRGKR